MDDGTTGGSEWQPADVKSEPACENEEITDTHPDIKTEVSCATIAETNSGGHRESSVFCSVQGLPLADRFASNVGYDASTLAQHVKVENIKDEDLSADAYPDTKDEVLSTTVPETGSGIYLESSVFCSVQGLPLADGSAPSSSYDAPVFTQQIKVENIKDENFPAEYPDSDQHFSPGPQSSPIPEQTSIFPEDDNLKVENDLAEEIDASKNNQQIYLPQTGKILQCPYCERLYGYEPNLRAHIRQQHEAFRVPCPFCTRTFTRPNAVRRHIAREHKAEITLTAFQQTQIQNHNQ